MRFHVGVSFSWKQIKKVILPILIAILLYFGLNMTVVHAESYTLPITGGGGGLVYEGNVSGGQDKWCTQTINSTEYVYRCGGLYDDTFSAGLSIYGEGNNLLNYSTQWFSNTGSLCDTTQTSIEFFVYAYPFELDLLGRSYDFFDYYDIASIAYPSAANSTCTYSKVQKNMLKINCVYNTGSPVEFNMYGRLKDIEPPYVNSFKMFIKRNINYTCNATNNDLNNTINNGFNNLGNIIQDEFNGLNEDVNNALDNTNDNINDMEDSIINNNNTNTDKITGFIDNFQNKVDSIFNDCRESNNLFDNSNINSTYNADVNITDTGLITINTLSDATSYVTYSINIKPNTTYTLSATAVENTSTSSSRVYLREYYSDGTYKVLFTNDNLSINNTFTTSSNAVRIVLFFYSGFSGSSVVNDSVTYSNIMLNLGSAPIKYEPYGIQVCTNKIEDTNQNLEDIENSITDSNIDSENANNFFTDFEENDFGLSDIVKSPLILIQELSNGSSCNSLDFNVLGANVSMPSGCILWNKVPDNIEAIYYVFIGGFLAYILGTKLFHDVNDLKDPNKNEVSTLDL